MSNWAVLTRKVKDDDHGNVLDSHHITPCRTPGHQHAQVGKGVAAPRSVITCTGFVVGLASVFWVPVAASPVEQCFGSGAGLLWSEWSHIMMGLVVVLCTWVGAICSKATASAPPASIEVSHPRTHANPARPNNPVFVI